MKVLAIVILAVASVTGKGSGPYLPRGWRPQGPAFLLPSEVKPFENLKDVILAGSEASGSDFLREYGPPKVQVISQNLINQGLPDAVTEQSFEIVPLVVKIKEAEQVVQNVEAKTEQALEQSEATTESAIKGDVTFDLPILVVENNVESTQVSLTNDEEASKANVISSENLEQSNQKTESSTSQESSSSYSQSSLTQESSSSKQVSQESLLNEESTEPQLDVTEKSAQTEGNSDESSARLIQVSFQQAQNIPDIIASLENENKAQQAEEAVNGLAVQAGAAFPEGFLEYGPPGFAEYGPPKVELNQDKENSADQSFEYTNETRRRRFSPKFKSAKKH